MQIQIQTQHIYPSHAVQQCFAHNTIKEQAIIVHSTLCIAITRFRTIRRGIFSHEVSKTQKLVGLFEFHQSKKPMNYNNLTIYYTGLVLQTLIESILEIWVYDNLEMLLFSDKCIGLV